MHTRAVLSLAACLALVACARKAESPAATTGPNEVTVIATDYAFATPETLPAGLTTLHMVNGGQEPHHMVLTHIAEGKTLADFQAAAKDMKIPDWMTFPGGPGATAPGDTTSTTQNLEPGQYVMVCYIPSPDGKAHVEKGMVRPFVVRGPAPATAATEPTADVTVKMSDYAFAFSTPLTAGHHVIRVENDGPQLHEITFEKLHEGKSMQDFVAWGQGGMKGPPPTTPAGGFIGPTKGGHGFLDVHLTPGKYLVLCYVPDDKDGKPHIMHGMMQEITIS
jgi:hypothetical protein